MEKQRRKAACARPTTRARPAPVVIPVDSPQWQVMLVTDDTIGNGPGATARDMQKVRRVSSMVYSARGNPVIRSELLRPQLPPLKGRSVQTFAHSLGGTGDQSYVRNLSREKSVPVVGRAMEHV